MPLTIIGLIVLAVFAGGIALLCKSDHTGEVGGALILFSPWLLIAVVLITGFTTDYIGCTFFNEPWIDGSMCREVKP